MTMEDETSKESVGAASDADHIDNPAAIAAPAPAGAPSPTPAIPQEPQDTAELRKISPLPPRETHNLQSDMAHILEGVKLPERREINVGIQKKIETHPPAVAPQVSQIAPQTQEPHGEPKKEKTDALFSLHTLKDDLQDVVRDKKISLVRAAALEQEKRKGQGRVADRSEAQLAHRRKMLFAISGGMLVIVLLLGAAFGIYKTAGKNAPAPAPVNFSLIFTEKTMPFKMGALQALDVKRSLARARTILDSPLGSVTRIVPIVSQTDENVASEHPATIGEFLDAIGSQASPDLIRSFKGDFFLGIHRIDENAPVLIIPIASYERAFAGMLAWESAMNIDLSPLFTAVPPQTRDASGLSVERQFEDAVMRNYDVRVLRDDSGAMELFYSFPARNILIIAESPNSFIEILSRLRANRQM